MQSTPTIGNFSLPRSYFGFFRKCRVLWVGLMLSALIGCGENGENDDLNGADPLDESSPSEQLEPTTAIERENSRGRKYSHLLLGTGSVSGVYFPIGGVICRLLNRHKSLHSIRCSLESTGGSIYNLRELRKGSFDLVFAQSDWQYHAYNGTSTFRDVGPNEELRSVFALEADPLALIVKYDSDIESFEDLENRVVSFGYTRSLQHRLMNDYLEVKGWDEDKFRSIWRMSDTKQVAAICTDKVESILLLTSSLEEILSKLPEDCKLKFVPMNGPEVDELIKQKSFYRTGVIQKGLFLDSESDVESFGLGASFVALESTSPKAIYHVVKEIVENFKDFQSLHPSLKTLSKKELPKAGLTAPLHPGAVRYYKEARLLR